MNIFAVSTYTNTVCPFLISRDLSHIQLQDVTTSQLIAYDTDRDLLPLILAQCNYSLEVGRGTLVQYNWDALERQLIDRFIRRKPLVDFKVNCGLCNFHVKFRLKDWGDQSIDGRLLSLYREISVY